MILRFFIPLLSVWQLPPPPFPEGYVPPSTADAEKGPEGQQSGEPQAPLVDPIIDQGPAKRMKI